MAIKKTNSTTKQVRKQAKTLKNGNPINKAAQFGQPNGNPRHNGAWKKEDTLRYKWEQILKMTDEELKGVMADPAVGRVEKMTAEVLLDKEMKPTEKIAVLDRLATQVYGFPKQSVETVDLTPPPALSPRKRKKNKR